MMINDIMVVHMIIMSDITPKWKDIRQRCRI